MGYMCIDIETYVSKDNPASGLNPYLKQSKVLIISYNYYHEFKISEKVIKPPTILKIWESNEKNILLSFYSFLKLKVEADPHLKYIGFNCVKFDLTYLLGRLAINEIDDLSTIYDILFRIPHTIDLGQLSQILSNNRFKEILNIDQKSANRFFGLPIKSGTGAQLSQYYDDKEFDKIISYVNEEFTFELLYIKLRRHLYSKETMIKDES